jgi:hypothetical protein
MSELRPMKPVPLATLTTLKVGTRRYTLDTMDTDASTLSDAGVDAQGLGEAIRDTLTDRTATLATLAESIGSAVPTSGAWAEGDRASTLDRVWAAAQKVYDAGCDMDRAAAALAVSEYFKRMASHYAEYASQTLSMSGVGTIDPAIAGDVVPGTGINLATLAESVESARALVTGVSTDPARVSRTIDALRIASVEAPAGA